MESQAQQSAPSVRSVGAVVHYKGMREASGAIAIPQGSFAQRFLVVDNETNVLRIYSRAKPGGRPQEIDVSSAAGLPSRSKEHIDLEAITWLNGRAMLMGSLGRTKKGKLKPARHKFLSVEVKATATGVRLVNACVAPDCIPEALAKLSDDFKKAIDLKGKKDKDLAPKRNGVNLEGLSAAADGTSLMLGFRNPLRAGKALVVKLLNPHEVLAGTAGPKLQGPYALFLGGLGIRSIEYCAGAGAYFIVAGPVAGGCAFDLFRWREGEKPMRIEGAGEALAAIKGFKPEGLIVDRQGTRLLLFGDNGGAKHSSFPGVILELE